MTYKETSDPRFDEALIWAAGHFLSSYPQTFTGTQILKAVRNGSDLDKNLRYWDVLDCGHEEVAELIELLARSFVRFGNREPLFEGF
jgi:hypothetical protein